MMSHVFPSLCAAFAVMIPNICDMVPPVKINAISALGSSIPYWEVSSNTATISAIQSKAKPLMPIQWSPLALAHTDHNNLSLGPNWSSPILNRTPVYPFKRSAVTTRQVLSNYTFALSFPFSFPDPSFMHASVHSSVSRRVSPQIAQVRPHPKRIHRSQVEDPITQAQMLFIDMLSSIQMYIIGFVCIPFMYVLLFLLGAGGFSLIIDVAMAVVGFGINIAGLDPTRQHTYTHVCRILAMIIRLCFKLMLNSAVIKMITFILIYINIQGTEATGRETPKIHFQEYFLPGVTRWDAIPYHDFRRVWWVALCAALGNVNQEGWSLLQTARNQDLGSPGNPGTPAQTIQSDNRNQRVFGAILNYIEANSWLYTYVSTNFANNGRGLFKYLYEVGHLAYTSEERTALENEWKDATIASVGIAYKPDAVFKWAQYINILADKLNKSERDKRVKYLQGFPSSFDVLVVAERARGAIGSFAHPANYPTHHPNAGAAHAHAGQPDIDAMARGFYSEWARMINNGQIKPIPKGFAHRMKNETRAFMMQDVDSGNESHDEDESAYMARDRVSDRIVCGVCGGIGHAGKIDGVGTCLTAKMNHRIPSQVLSSISYPEGYKRPDFHKSNSNRSRFQSNRSNKRYDSNPRARFTNDQDDTLDPEGFEPPSESDMYAMRFQKIKPRPKAKSAIIKKTRARMANEASTSNQSQETEQNSAHDAHDNEESDEDEHGRLAVSIENVVFK